MSIYTDRQTHTHLTSLSISLVLSEVSSFLLSTSGATQMFSSAIDVFLH